MMARGLLIAILASLQLPQAIAGSIAICCCTTEMVAAAKQSSCHHCDGSCHAESAALEQEDAKHLEAIHDHTCTDCLHVSLFAGDNVRTSVTWATVDAAPIDMISIVSVAPVLVSPDRPSDQGPADLWLSVSGAAIALRC